MQSSNMLGHLLEWFRTSLGLEESDVVIRSRHMCAEDGVYELELLVHNTDVYTIRHFDPCPIVQEAKIMQEVNYGMGPYYECCLFRPDKNQFERVQHMRPPSC